MSKGQVKDFVGNLRGCDVLQSVEELRSSHKPPLEPRKAPFIAVPFKLKPLIYFLENFTVV